MVDERKKEGQSGWTVALVQKTAVGIYHDVLEVRFQREMIEITLEFLHKDHQEIANCGIEQNLLTPDSAELGDFERSEDAPTLRSS